jgi:hypothetical protein
VTAIDTVPFFDTLASRMNAQPTSYEVLGDVDMDFAIVMQRPEGDPFRILLTFRGITCEGVTELEAGDETRADFRLEGDLSAWQTMFDDIDEHGHATGRQTLNSLTLLGDAIAARGSDPLGVDKFFRFNQSVQAFVDGAGARADIVDVEPAPR